MTRSYRNYIFDLYGTLADIRTDETLPALWDAVSAFFAHRGMSREPEELREMYTRKCVLLQKQQDMFLALRGVPGPAEIDILNVWDLMAEEMNGSLTLPEKLEFSGLFRERSTLKLRLFPGAEEVLKGLRGSGKTACLLTNAQESFTRPELDRLGITGCFDRIFYSSRSGVKKPSPAFFAELSAAGLEPDVSLMIGNDDICDCRGAAAAGMDSLYIRTEQSPEPGRPLPAGCREIFSLYDIPGIGPG